jgi:uncharacterized protein (TIGR03086 family)
MVNAKNFYLRCVQQATEVVKYVETSYLHNPTPDTEWSVADLLKHMMYELAWTPDMVRGLTIRQVGHRHDSISISTVSGDVFAQWNAQVHAAKAAVNSARLDATAHPSYGDTTVENYLRDAGTDQLIHAWGLAEGMGVVMQFETDLAQAIFTERSEKQAVLAETGLFAKPIPVPDTVDIQTKVLALHGRSLNWRAA